MARKIRAFVICPKAWTSNQITIVSNEARGIYMKLLIRFYHSSPAYLRRPIPFQASNEIAAAALQELVDAEIIKVEPTGVVIIDQCGSKFIRKPLTDAARKRIFERDSYNCRHCGSVSNLTVDHILSVHKGGINSDDNLQTLCRSCNGKKGF